MNVETRDPAAEWDYPISPEGGPAWLASTVCALLMLVCTGYLAWAQWPVFTGEGTRAQGDAAMLPFRTIAEIAAQLKSTSLFEEASPVRALFAALFTCLWAHAVHMCGRALLRRSGLELNRAERLAFSMAVGLLVVGTAVLLLGLARLLTTGPLIAVATVAGLVAIVETRSLVASLRAGPMHPSCSFSARVLLLLAGVLCFLLFCIAALPPVQSDAMRYHLAAPQQFLRVGRISALPHNAFSNFPMLREMHMMVALAARVPPAAQMMHFVVMLVTAAGVYGTAQRLLAMVSHSTHVGIAALTAALLYMFVPAGAVVATWPNIDHATSLYALLSVSALMLIAQKPCRDSYLLLGAMCAGCAASKYTLLVHVAVVGLAWICLALGRPAARGLHGRLALFAPTIFVFVAGPWYLKNLVLTGNPVYPLANSIFHGGDWTAECAKFYAERASSKGGSKSLPGLFAAPFRSTFDWLNYEAHNPGAVTLVSWILALAAVSVAVRCRRRAFFLLLGPAAGYWLTWYFSYQSNRMLLPFYAMVLPLLPVAIAAAAPALRRLTLAIVAASALAGGFWALQWSTWRPGLTPPAVPYLLGGMSDDIYMARSLTYWQGFRHLNNIVQPGERVLLIGEHRIYGADFDAYWSDWFDTPALAAFLRENQVHSVDALLEKLREQKFRYILINGTELAPQGPLFRNRLTSEEWDIFQQLSTTKLTGVEVERIPQVQKPGSSSSVPLPGITILHLDHGK
jgi:hypothetical protein